MNECESQEEWQSRAYKSVKPLSVDARYLTLAGELVDVYCCHDLCTSDGAWNSGSDIAFKTEGGVVYIAS